MRILHNQRNDSVFFHQHDRWNLNLIKFHVKIVTC